MAIGSSYHGEMMRRLLHYYDSKGWFERIDIHQPMNMLEGYRVVVRYHDGMSRSVDVMSSDIDALKKAIEELSWRPYDPSKPLPRPQQVHLNPVSLNPAWQGVNSVAIHGVTSV